MRLADIWRRLTRRRRADDWIVCVDRDTGAATLPAGPVGKAVLKLQRRIEDLERALDRERGKKL